MKKRMRDPTGKTLVQNRTLALLIYAPTTSVLLFFLFLFRPSPLPLIHLPFTLSIFFLSVALFSSSLRRVSSPHPLPSASLFDVIQTVSFPFVAIVSGGGGSGLDGKVKRRVAVLVRFVDFLLAAGVSGFFGLGAVRWRGFGGFVGVGVTGFFAGLLYGVWYLYKRRWVLEFPIIQRPFFFSFKMGILSSVERAFKLSIPGYLFSALLSFFLLDLKGNFSIGKIIVDHIRLYVGTFVVFLCWELSHHIHQVLFAKRFPFAPPKGSAAAETNPSEPLLAALEGSPPRSLLHYLAHLDLCMTSELNVDTWRRAAFFEETGETYKRVVAACLKPLEQLTLRLGKSLESIPPDKSLKASSQLSSTAQQIADSELYEPFYDLQLCAWCARTASSLTVHSHKEDRYGVAQLTGSNASIISTLLACLLAVETFMGKKTNIQPSFANPAGIKWAALDGRKGDMSIVTTGVKKGTPEYSKAYSMADILRTSLYSIVSSFHDEMLISSKAGLLDKDWIASSKPLYGSSELLLQKLRLFLDFQAC